MTKPPAPTSRAIATLEDVIDCESTGVEHGGRIYYAWLRLRDGRCAVWHYDVRVGVGQDQTLRVIEGA